ncbi:energy-coupling factor transporter transmembrane component T family protein [Rubrobacter xylanophilus]|uniref:energy-coupling factor transporter transmembrane component T family protein n=1 Tax=Rubrobacter xylanophilus TaxID=49319 RepID=UPI0018DD0C64|nr:energy-coupling factor transporter transmembrane component T [Rubrobacter xylanophilus]
MKNLLDYQAGNSLVHRLNPVTKLVLAGSLVIIAFLLPDYRGPLLMTLLLLGIAVSAGIFRQLIVAVGVVATPLAIALLTIHGLFYPGNRTPLVSLGPATFWEEGLQYALLILFRLLVLITAILPVMLTTYPKKMTIALIEKGLSPKLAYVFMASLQFIPDMQRRAKAISEAQQARGLDIKASLWKRFRALIAMMVPLLTGALIAAETRSLALEARGFNRKGARTYLFDVPDPGVERVLRWAAVVVVLAAMVWKVAV